MSGKAASTMSGPSYHTNRIKQMLEELIAHLRREIDKVDEPKAQVLFETSAEELTGLKTAFDYYDAGKETAFRRQ